MCRDCMCLRGPRFRSVDLPLYLSPSQSDRSGTSYPRDLRDTRALRVPPCARVARTRRLGHQHQANLARSLLCQPASRFRHCFLGVSGISQVPRQSIPRLCGGPRPRTTPTASPISASRVLPPVPTLRRRRQDHDIGGLTPSLCHPLSTLDE